MTAAELKCNAPGLVSASVIGNGRFCRRLSGLQLPLRWLISFRAAKRHTFLVFFAIGLHHFMADACIWKLRHPEVRRSLSG